MKDKKKEIRLLNVEVRIINEAEGLVDYVASDATLDCYNEVILPAGWRFTQFQRNAPFVDSHDYSTIEKLLGSVVDYKVEGGALIERAKWAVDVKENALAQLGFKMTASGHLKAVSVGFYPLACLSAYDTANAAAYQDAVAKLDLPAGARPDRIFTLQEQIELSACILGANPSALAKAHTAGAITDEDLARVGFDQDDDVQFLHDCAAACERGELRSVLRRQMASELDTIFQKRHRAKSAPAAANAAPATSARGLHAALTTMEKRRALLRPRTAPQGLLDAIHPLADNVLANGDKTSALAQSVVALTRKLEQTNQQLKNLRTPGQ